MKRSLFVFTSLFVFAAIGSLIFSCSKGNNPQRLSYSLDSVTKTVYIGDTGFTQWPLKVSFLSGNPMEQISLKFNGLPARLTVSPDSIAGTPTFYPVFTFHALHLAHQSYPAQLIAYSSTRGYITYNLNIVVVTANCGQAMAGVYNCNNACRVSSTGYVATVTALNTDTVNINNLGGYGTSSNTIAALNCDVDSILIPKQADGNGDTIRGVGTYTATQMTIYYAKWTQTGAYDTCVATMNKQ